MKYRALAMALFATTASAAVISIDGTAGRITTITERTDGLVDIRTYGQRFQVPSPTSENLLVDFGFTFVNVLPTTGTFDYRAFVYAWDTATAKPTGIPLYTSGPLTMTDALAGPVTFTGVNLLLTPGTTYVAFLSTIGVSNSITSAQLAVNAGDVYAGGGVASMSSDGAGTGAFTTASWGTSAQDMAFRATFVSPAAVPESNFGLGAGLIGVSILLCRQIRRVGSLS